MPKYAKTRRTEDLQSDNINSPILVSDGGLTHSITNDSSQAGKLSMLSYHKTPLYIHVCQEYIWMYRHAPVRITWPLRKNFASLHSTDVYNGMSCG